MQRDLGDWRIACHEAGHVLANFFLGFRTGKVSISESDSLGRVTKWRTRMESREFIESANRTMFYDRATSAKIARWHDEVVALLAGGAAERLLAPNPNIHSGMGGDLDAVDDMLLRIYPENEARHVFKWLQTRAKNMVSDRVHREMIRDLATALISKREMNGQKAIALLRDSFDRQTLPAALRSQLSFPPKQPRPASH
jgi:hypothetical protein